MVGDRLLTDILVGNKMKLMTILVEPMGEDLSKMVKWMRKLEKVLLTF
jgi:predicted HAD superfamily phosphohydrolase YqeG